MVRGCKVHAKKEVSLFRGRTPRRNGRRMCGPAQRQLAQSDRPLRTDKQTENTSPTSRQCVPKAHCPSGPQCASRQGAAQRRSRNGKDIFMTCERSHTAAFTGHRTYRGEAAEALASLLGDLHAEGYRRFLCGMALGFDMAAAEAVLALRAAHPRGAAGLRRTLRRPGPPVSRGGAGALPPNPGGGRRNGRAARRLPPPTAMPGATTA